MTTDSRAGDTNKGWQMTTNSWAGDIKAGWQMTTDSRAGQNRWRVIKKNCR